MSSDTSPTPVESFALSTGQSESLLSMSYEDFVKFQLPLYHGPIVSIKMELRPTTLPRHFSASIRRPELEKLDGVLSTQSFQLLLQWLYLGRFNLGKESPSDRITTMIELARLADMMEIKDIDAQIAEYIRTTVLDNPSPTGNYWCRSPDDNIYHITPEHVVAASHLPKGHSIRLLLARAAINAYLNSDDFRFSRETQDVPEFAADLLQELRVALKSIECDDNSGRTYHDPFTETKLQFYQ
ncbi:hypothetical protein BJY01DRAFT_249615 [Aspergillus pseudoustus]|uniref:BTB domain-containing protein n=1 Tax=Aspergillus pseudoustus TaxID=1810923 RepID=A0ABR4JMM8_9EURO